MRVTSLVAAVASHTGKIWKFGKPCFWKGKKFVTKWRIKLCI